MHDEVGIRLGRRRDGAEMEDRGDRAAPARVSEERRELLRRNDSGKLALGEVAPFLAAAEAVAYNEIALAALLEGGDQIGADESGAAGNDDHSRRSPAIDGCSW